METLKRILTNNIFLNNFVSAFLILLLIVSSFALGSLWTRNKSYEALFKNGGLPSAANDPSANAGGGNEPAQVNIVELAASAGVDRSKVESCINSGETSKEVDVDYQSGLKAGVTGT